jgi:nitrogen fixation protein NifX
MKIAFTSTDGRTVDTHFGNATSFQLWEIGPHAACQLDTLTVADSGEQEDRIVTRAEALNGCTLLCTVQIGGPAAAKLVARHIHPMKTPEGTPIREFIEKLQTVLRGSPPPWLRKAIATEPVAAV